jgi:hypothetical protein
MFLTFLFFIIILLNTFHSLSYLRPSPFSPKLQWSGTQLLNQTHRHTIKDLFLKVAKSVGKVKKNAMAIVPGFVLFLLEEDERRQVRKMNIYVCIQ